MSIRVDVLYVVQASSCLKIVGSGETVADIRLQSNTGAQSGLSLSPEVGGQKQKHEELLA